MTMLKAFIAATTLSLMSGVVVAEGAPQTRFTLYHEAQLPEAEALQNEGETKVATRDASNGISVYDAEINLLEDYDNDDHYSRFEVIYDADDLSGHGLYAYTVVSLVDERGHIQTLFTSPTFYIYGDTNSDAQRHMITLLDDYSPGDYRLRIDLYDSCCSERLDTLITSSQEPIPLEGQYYDTTSYATETYVETHHYEDDHGAGGSWGLGGMGALGLLYFLRRQRLDALVAGSDSDNLDKDNDDDVGEHSDADARKLEA